LIGDLAPLHRVVTEMEQKKQHVQAKRKSGAEKPWFFIHI
jgi:hypothetical protein